MRKIRKLTEEELAIRKKCRNICNFNDKEDSIKLIEEEYPGCAVSIAMNYSFCRGYKIKQFMGMFLWRNVDIFF